MKNHIHSIKTQRGAASLFTALILLVGITLVTFLTAKTVLVATQMTANNYRSAQAFAAANAGMDYALAYFGDPGHTTFACDDPPADWLADYLLTLPNTTARVCIDNTPPTNPPTPLTTPWGVTVDAQCLPCMLGSTGNCTNPPQTTAGIIIATGWSDDQQAQRTITQCVGTRSLLAGGGPAQTLVSGSVVNLTGSAKIFNRFNDLNIWSAGNVDIGSSAMETYIRPTNLEINDLSFAQLTEVPSPQVNNAQKVSSNGLGTGTDIYHSDAVLAAAKAASDADRSAGGVGDGPDTFFDMFFPDIRKAEIARSAQSVNQYFEGDADSAQLAGLSGIVYVGGNASIGANNQIGSPDAPVLLFIEGNLSITGATIYGVVYVAGEIGLGAGNTAVVGSLISEGSVSGAGTLDLVYMPFGDGSGSGSVLPGLTGIIAGSWRDW